MCWLGCPRADVVPYVLAHLLTYLPTYLLCLHKLCGRPQCMTRAVCRRNGRNCAPALSQTPTPTPTLTPYGNPDQIIMCGEAETAARDWHTRRIPEGYERESDGLTA